MRAGEEFKRLAELCEADRSSRLFSVIDAAHPLGVRPLTVNDTYGEVEALALPPSVPDGIRGYFDAARMLWVYGWFYYPFYTWAGLHAAICAEMGLKHRFAAATPPLAKRSRKFDGMLEEAVRRQWLRADGFTRIRKRVSQPFEPVTILEASETVVATSTPSTMEELEKLVLRQLSILRGIRNWQAHPEAFNYTTPHSGYALLEFTRDLLAQLFSPAPAT